MTGNAIDLDILQSTAFYTAEHGSVVIDSTFDAINELVELIALLKLVRTAQPIRYKLVYDDRSQISVSCNEQIGMRILNFLFVPKFNLQHELGQFVLSPEVAYFLNEYKRLELRKLYVESTCGYGFNEIAPHVVDVFNEFIFSVQGFLQNKACKGEIDNFQRTSLKNFASAKGYLAQLFAKYSRLMIIRLDLSYQSEIACNVPLEIVLAHRKKFLEAFRTDKILKRVIGYLWKLEFGKSRGYHFHFMLVFDGSKHREDVTIAKYIGEYWNETVTANTGVYFNCNSRKIKYRDCGIGIVSYDADERTRNGLELALAYLTKPDRYIKLIVGKKNRTFGRGSTPRPKTSTVGRPRRQTLRSSNVASLANTP